MKAIYTFVLSIFLCSTIDAQVKGNITNDDGEPLAFATIYVQGTSTGTTSNIEGDYILPLDPGSYELVFQYVGYGTRIEKVTLANKVLTLNVTLSEESVDLTEVVVQANGEDPAYRVIRAAIAKRKFHYEQVESYACDVYVKGNIKFLDAPEKILGQEIGDLGGTLDSNRQGIIYLSESQAELYYKLPDKFKEVMLSTKVSGNDNGFGFNRASDMDFNLYRNYSNLGRQIISPIASNALAYYRYRLEGVKYDEKGRLINKIEVIPKRDEDPTYRGYVYIIEDLWNIQSAELILLQSSIKQPGLDTLTFNQVYVPVDGKEVWKVFSQTIDFRAGFFGFKMQGTFTGVYTNYDTSPELDDKFFDQEVFKVEEEANDKTLEYWNKVRPIPLTQEEAVDYVRKDSLQEVRQSKAYLDSVDRKNNQFKPLNLIFGYSYDRSYKKSYFNFDSPLNAIHFNTVQGWNFDLNFSYLKEYDDYYTKWFSIRPRINYGFGDKQVRASAAFIYNFNRTNFSRLSISGGRTVQQFNPANPLSRIGNTLATLWSRQNYMKIYDKEFGRIGYSQELTNGIFFRGGMEYAKRSALVNTSDYSLRKRDEIIFTANDPQNPEAFGISAFDPNNALTLDLALRFRIKQKYSQYPGRKYLEGTKWPDIWLLYRKGIAGFDSDVNYDLASILISDTYIPLGVWGHSEFRLQAGKFLNNQALEFMDFRHFVGNQLIIGRPSRYRAGFLNLPYYSNSTSSEYVEVHFQHFFEGYFLDKIPFIQKLGWSLVGGIHYLNTPELPSYQEFTLGVDNVGFGLFRLFRLDGYLSHTDGNWRLGGVIGIKL